MMDFDANNAKNATEDDNDETEFATPQIFIESLLKLRHNGIVTDQQIRELVNFILFAGQDTSSYTIAMTIFLLATHPKVEEHFIDEC